MEQRVLPDALFCVPVFLLFHPALETFPRPGSPTGPMHFRPLALLLLLPAAALAAPLDDAVALYRAKRYPEARAALATLTAAEPKNAAACYYYGMTLRLRGDSTALEDAAPWLAKAAELEPTNATYLADFGGTSLQLAGKTRSVSAATRGRDAMVRSLELNPDNLDAREGLLQFYAQAPWPIGSSSKAADQAAEIAKRDPVRGLLAQVTVKTSAKKYAEASALCEDFLKQSPESFQALYQIGRLASLSGENLDRGIVTLRRCLTLTPPPNYATHANVQFRLGTLLEKKGDQPAARTAYQAALKLDPGYKNAADALAKLGP